MDREKPSTNPGHTPKYRCFRINNSPYYYIDDPPLPNTTPRSTDLPFRPGYVPPLNNAKGYTATRLAALPLLRRRIRTHIRKTGYFNREFVVKSVNLKIDVDAAEGRLKRNPVQNLHCYIDPFMDKHREKRKRVDLAEEAGRMEKWVRMNGEENREYDDDGDDDEGEREGEEVKYSDEGYLMTRAKDKQ